MNEQISIIDLRKSISKDLNHIPNWIKTTDHLHYILWQTILECNAIIFKLVKKRILDDKFIEEAYSEYFEFIQAIIENTDTPTHIQILTYYSDLLTDLILKAENEEHYEVCANLMKFQDLYIGRKKDELDF